MMLKKKYYTGLQIHEAIDGVVGDYQKAIEIYRRLAKMETDDLVPVVRCKDCKHGERDNIECLRYVCEIIGATFDRDFYCAFGERSEDEHTD